MDDSFLALDAVGFMKLAVERRAAAVPVAAVFPAGPPLVVGRAVESRMLSVAVVVLVGEGAEERETSLFDRLKMIDAARAMKMILLA